MRNLIIKILLQILNKLEVLDLPQCERNFEYFYVSTKTTDANSKEKWINWSKAVQTNSIDCLLEERKNQGWYIKKVWHTTEKEYGSMVWHTHWYLARKITL